MIFEEGIIGSQLNKYLSRSLGSVGEYNANNTWYFNGNNRNLNNNNRYNSNFRCRPCSDYINTGEPANQHVVSLEELQIIEESCKSSKPNCVRFRTNKIHSLIEIRDKLNNNEVEITKAMVFTIKVPKLREIIYCSYSDKLIQSYYVFSLKKYLETNWYDKDSYSCRDGKGVLKAIEQYKTFIREAIDIYGADNIYLASLDIKRFFLSIDTRLLAEKMARFIETNLNGNPNKERLLYLTQCLYVIDWHKVDIEKVGSEDSYDIPKEKTLCYSKPYVGVPIGNWPSQIGGNFITTFALVFLRGLGYCYFVHYTDDTCFVIPEKEKYLRDIRLIEKFYKEVLHLELHKSKRYLQHVSKGITILGRRIRFDRCIASKRTVNAINTLVYSICEGKCSNEKYIKRDCEHIAQSINSYMGMLVHMDMYRYRKRILERIKKKHGKYFKIDEKNYTKINVRKEYKTKNKYLIYITSKKNEHKEIRQNRLFW